MFTSVVFGVLSHRVLCAMFLAPSSTDTSPIPNFCGVRQKVAKIGIRPCIYMEN